MQTVKTHPDEVSLFAIKKTQFHQVIWKFFACEENLHAFLAPASFPSKLSSFFLFKSFRNTIQVSNSLDSEVQTDYKN